MPDSEDVSLNVIFPIGQELYDAVMEQARRTGASFDQLYAETCAEAFTHMPGLVGRQAHELRLFHLEELGHRENMGGLMQATLVLAHELYAAVQAIAQAQKKPVEAICEGLCVGALQAKTGIL